MKCRLRFLLKAVYVGLSYLLAEEPRGPPGGGGGGSLVPNKISLCSLVGLKVFFSILMFRCSLNRAFVPVFPALFLFCSLVPNNFKGMFPCP